MRMTWSCPVCGTVNQDYRRKCTARDCRHLRRRGTFARVRGTAVARVRRRLRPVDDGRVPIVPTRTTCGEVIATVAVEPSALGDVEAMAVAVLQGSRLSERLSGITSRRKVAWRRLSQLGGARMRVQPRPRSKIAPRQQAGCGYRRGSSAEEVGETGAQGSDAVPQVYQGAS